MSWLIAAISAYFFLALVALGDKYLLTGDLNPKTYTFYAGVLGVLVLFLIPIVGLTLPDFYNIFLCFLTGTIFVVAIFIFYHGLELFEVSRVVPAVGGLLPIFTFLLSLLFFQEENIDFKNIISFLLLILGAFLITKDKRTKIPFKCFIICLFSSLLFSFYFVLSKYLYGVLPFFDGFILIRIGAFLFALLFIFTKDVRREIFKPNPSFKNIRTSGLFFLNQSFAAIGVFLQNLAVFLAPVYYLATINALEGIRYVFLFIFTVFISLKFPNILKEKISKKIIWQKIIAMAFIILGVATLTF